MRNQSPSSDRAQSRKLARRDRLSEMVDNLYANASRFGWSQERVNEVLTTVFADETYKRLPQYMRSYLSGYSDAVAKHTLKRDAEDVWLLNNKVLNIHELAAHHNSNDTQYLGCAWKSDRSTFWSVAADFKKVPTLFTITQFATYYRPLVAQPIGGVHLTSQPADICTHNSE
jgi:hypothetical protein